MYYKLNNDELKTMQKVDDITSTDYGIIGNFIPVENLLRVIEDLLMELNNRDETLEDLKNDIRENYKFVGECYYEYGE